MASSQDLLLIVQDDGESTSALRGAAERLKIDRIEVDNPRSLSEVLLLRRPSIVVMAVDRVQADPLQILGILATHNLYPSILLIGSSDTRVLESVRRAAESRGFPVIGVRHRPLAATMLEQVLISYTTAAAHFEEDELAKALAHQEFTLLYQPIAAVAEHSLTIARAEALIRWQHPLRGQLLPRHFMAAVASNDLATPLTDFVIVEAIRQAGDWHSRGLPLGVVLNLSTDLIKDRAFADRLESALKEHEVQPCMLSLDITNSSGGQNFDLIFDVFTRLRNLGVNLAIDNFVTSSSSLMDLYQFPFSEIKIDGSLLQSATKDREGAILLRAVARLANELGIRLGAKGIEHIDTLELIQTLDFETVQGRLICSPVAASEVERLALAGPFSHPAKPSRKETSIPNSINDSAILRRPPDLPDKALRLA